MGCRQYRGLLSFCVTGYVPCFPSEVHGVEGLSSGQQTGQGLERASFSSASPQASRMTLGIQIACVDFTFSTVDLGARLVTLGEWWMWEWGAWGCAGGCKTY